MTLPELSIRRPVFAWMLFTGLTVFGVVSFLRLGISQLPDVDFPVVAVSLNLPGAAPGVMETDVVDPVENAIMMVEGIKRVTSSCRKGSASLTVEFDLGRDVDVALQDVQAKIMAAMKLLPRDMDPPVLTKTNPQDNPVAWISLHSKKYSRKELMIFVRDYLKDQFTTLPGVGDVLLAGYVEPNLRIWLSSDKLNRQELSAEDVVSALVAEHQEPPSGYLEEGGGKKELNVRMLGELESPEGFNELAILRRGGQASYRAIRLSEVGRVEDGLNDIRRISRSNMTAAVGLGIQKQIGSNEVALARAIRKRVAEIKSGLPEGMELNVDIDNGRFIEESISDMYFTLAMAVLLTGMVIWLFLGSWGSTFNVLLAIPTSILGTLIVFGFAGYTLNTFTLMALSLAVGIIVDDAIMVLENIYRHREMGKRPVVAAETGANQIAMAAIATTASLVAIFVPVIFVHGMMGLFLAQFGVAMAVAVLLSLLEALTLTPMRISQMAFVDDVRGVPGKFSSVIRGLFESLRTSYVAALSVALSHRWKVLLALAGFFIASLATLPFLKVEFVPPQDQGIYKIGLKTPVGSSLEYTDMKVKKLEEILLKRGEVTRVFTTVGGTPKGKEGSGDVTAATVLVTLKAKGHRGKGPGQKREMTQAELMALTRKAIKSIGGIRGGVNDFSMRGLTSSSWYPVEFTVQGPDWTRLAEYSALIMEQLRQTGLVIDLDTDYQVAQEELHIIPDRVQAMARGVSVSSIGTVINVMISGITVGQFTRGGHRNDIRVKLEDDARKPEETIKTLSVRNNRGELVPLRDVVRIERQKVPQIINRVNRQRSVTIFANLAPGKSQNVALSTAESVARKILPAGYRVEFGGTSADFKQAFAGFALAILLGILAVYMVLASQFNSYRDPFIILAAVPFSISGALLALLATGHSINLYSVIGLILLLGLTMKNSILLVEYTNQLRKAGNRGDVAKALLEACPIRLRPILMTSVAIIAGAVPAALSLGPGAETRIPMSVVVIGGMAVSTMLTLFLVPCLYMVIADRAHKS